MKAKAALDTVSTVVPSVVGMGIGVGVVTPTLFLSFYTTNISKLC